MHADFFCGLLKLHVARRNPGRPTGQFFARVPFQISSEGVGIVPRQQNLRGARCKNDRVLEGWIEHPEVVCADFSQARGQGHINIAVDTDGFEIGMVFDLWQFSVECLRVGDDVFQGLQFRHVVTRFFGHAQAVVISVFASCFVTADGSSDIPLSPVVGSQCEMPVSKHAVELLKVVQCCACGFQHITALIHEQVLFEIKVEPCGGHELPHACSFGGRDRLRIEGRFDKGKKSQFHGHLPPFQLLNNMEKVRA